MLLAQGQIFPARTLYGSGPVTVFPEGFVAVQGQRLSFCGEREAVLEGPGTLILEDGEGNRIPAGAEVVITPASSVPEGRRALVLCIGESTCGLVNANPFTGSYADGWNWASMLRRLALQDGVDIRCLGTETLPDAPLDACYTAHGGWSAYTFLHWPVAAKMDPWAPDSFLKAPAMWKALGLEGVTGKPFEGAQWQFDLMAQTPYGKYRPDRDAPALPQAPVNEFWPGFSLETYLERYRTLDDFGEPLPATQDNPAGEKVWGSDGKLYTVGSRIVSQALLRRVQVCRPTHVVLNLGINDGDSACSAEVSARCLEQMMDAFGSIPVAWFVNRWPGVCRKDLWEDGYVPRQYEINGNSARVMAIFTALAALLRDRPDRYILDVWHTQFPASQHEERLLPDGRLDCSVNDVHLGWEGQLTAARQVQGWLYRLLSR